MTLYSRFRYAFEALLAALFILNRIRLLFSVILLLFIANHASGQILVAGTSFEPINPADANARAYIGMNEIIQTGFQTGAITVIPPIAPDADLNTFNGAFYHAVTNNPIKLDSARYMDLGATTDYQLVVSSTPAGQPNILTYKVNGLAPGSPVSVRVEYCSVISPGNIECGPGEVVSLRGVINPDQFNLNNGLEGTQVSAGGPTAGGCYVLTITEATSNSNPIAADGGMMFRLNAQQTGPCKAVAIRSIEVFGTPQPKVISADGDEVCAGEQITLQTTQNYNGTYQWEANPGSGWVTIAGTSNSILYETTTAGTYQFRATVTPSGGGSPITTAPVSVNAIACCTQNGAPASRKTIFYDNFGRLDMSNTAGTSYYEWDYSDPLNPVEVLKTTATPFRWPLVPAPLGATFVGGPGVIDDGQYAVAAYITGYNSPHNGYAGAQLLWANRVTGPTVVPNPDLAYDHSGAADGAALFLNCPAFSFGNTLYERTITNLCENKQLFFECWIAVFTNSSGGAVYNPVNVRVVLTDGGDPTNFTEMTGTATRQADGGGVWVKISGQITLDPGSTSLNMKIINNQNVTIDGNDLVIDDIKIMACAPPTLDLYFDLTTLAQTTDICNDATLPLYVMPSAMLTNYYGGAPEFLYQWTRTPNDVTTWQNLGAPGTPESFSIPNPKGHAAFDGLIDGDKVYFRVIAATSGIFASEGNFVAPNYANINDPCKNYSVSTAIEATLNCPLPVEWINFTANAYSGGVLLSWTTAGEKNNEYFNVERSLDGINFETIGRADGKGTTDILSTYRFNDYSAPKGNVYYRLAQYDNDGTVSYSSIRMVQTEKLYQVFVSPNPNAGSFSVSFQGASGSEVKLSLYNTLGQIVYEESVNQNSENFSKNLNVQHLPTGIYLLHVVGSTEKSITKIIKE